MMWKENSQNTTKHIFLQHIFTTNYSETCCHLDIGLVEKNFESRIKKFLEKAMRNRKVIHYVYTV